MDNEIKNYIINNFKDDDEKTIKDAINDSIKSSDEVALPGLGVFLSIYWETTNENEKDLLVKKIYEYIKKSN